MRYKESEILEFKKSTSELKEAIVSITAILNKHQKGEVYFGIKNDGTIIGQLIGGDTLRDISKAISDYIEPKIYPNIIIKKIKGIDCILVEFKGEALPYYAYGRAYMRVADENRQLSARELEKIIERKNNYHSKWETEVSTANINQASSKTIRQFTKKANDVGRIDYRYDNARNVLNKLGLLKKEMLLNAGQVLFCDNNKAEVQAAVFAGNDKITFLDIQSFHGNLFELIEKSESYVKEHINWRADLSGSRRIEIPEIPVRAIKEAIINSLCHRDFANQKGNEIAIFKNRIEIYNPGRFPEDYSPADFIKGEERSILRNPLIANAFYLTSDIERWGSGLKRIYDACKETKIRVEFKNLKSGFLVAFYRHDRAQNETQDVEKVVRKGGQKRWSELTGRQKTVLDAVGKNPSISRKELSNVLGVNPSAVQKYLQKLKQLNILRRIGPDRGGHWQIVENRKKM